MLSRSEGAAVDLGDLLSGVELQVLADIESLTSRDAQALEIS